MQGRELLHSALPLILDVFEKQGLVIKNANLEEELSRLSAVDAAIDARSRHILISGLEQLSPTDLVPKKNPLPSKSPHGMEHARRRSSALLSPHVDKDLMVRTLELPLCRLEHPN